MEISEAGGYTAVVFRVAPEDRVWSDAAAYRLIAQYTAPARSESGDPEGLTRAEAVSLEPGGANLATARLCEVPSPLEYPVDLVLMNPIGEAVFERRVSPERLRTRAPFDVAIDDGIALEPPEGETPPVTLSGSAFVGSGAAPASRSRVTIYARSARTGRRSAVFTSETDSRGYFFGPCPAGSYSEAFARIGSSDERVAIALGADGRLPERLALIAASEVADDDGCCEHLVARVPGARDLASGDYSADLDPAHCSDFRHKPDRTLQEVQFFAAVRLTQPEIRSMAARRKASQAGAAPRPLAEHKTPGSLAKSSSTDTLALRGDLLTREIEGLLELPFGLVPAARRPLAGSLGLDWEGKASAHQATEVAHGHLLRYKQSWHADGYSLGNLLYSLPLAPCQKRRIAIVDWDRRETGARSDDVAVQEELLAELVRDRDVREVLASLLAQDVSGGSRAQQQSFSAGIGIGGIGDGFGGFLGVAGGYAKGTFRSWQDSAQKLGSTFSNRLVDRTAQSQEAQRKLRTTVVTAVGQGERVSATTEVVANHNHCHALTVQYFEVLRHFVVRQELDGVEECLFVPLKVAPFSLGPAGSEALRDGLRRALRHREALAPALRSNGFADAARAFAAARRIVDGVADRVAIARRPVTWIDGTLSLEFRLGRPQLGRELEWFQRLLNTVPDLRTSATIGGLELTGDSLAGGQAIELAQKARAKLQEFLWGNAAIREQFFEDEVAPAVVRRLVEIMSLGIWSGGNAPVPIEGTVVLLDDYTRGGRIEARFVPSLPIQDQPALVGITRTDISALALRLRPPLGATSPITSFDPDVPAQRRRADPEWLPPHSQVLVRSLSFDYRAALSKRSFELVRGGVGDLADTVDPQRPPMAAIATAISRDEERDPDDEDLELATRLLRHLNGDLMHYHRAMWQHMSPADRFMLLDAIVAPGAAGQSVAQVVRNEVVGIAGNSLIMPVAPGIRLNNRFHYAAGDDVEDDLRAHYAPPVPAPPMRFTVPTRGVFADAIMGSCNSCETIDESRFWRWEESPCPDEPAAIAPVSTESRHAAPPALDGQTLPPAVVQIQNAPAAPPPTGLGPAVDLVTRAGLFRDVRGQAQLQENVSAALSSTLSGAQSAASMAAALAMAEHTSQNLDKLMGAIDSAESAGDFTTEEAAAQRQSLFERALGSIEDAGSDVAGRLRELTREAASSGRAYQARVEDGRGNIVLAQHHGVDPSKGQGGSGSGPSPGAVRVDPTLRVPRYPDALRRTFGPLLSDDDRKKGADYINDTLPTVLGTASVEEAQNSLHDALLPYVDMGELATQMAGARDDEILVEAVHQFQRTVYSRAGDSDGVPGPSTLFTLGYAPLLSAADARQYSSMAEHVPEADLECDCVKRFEQSAGAPHISAAEWYRYLGMPAFVGQKFKSPAHVVLVRQLRLAEAFMLDEARKARPLITPVELGADLGINGRHGALRKGTVHGTGLAMDTDITDNPWVGGEVPEPWDKKLEDLGLYNESAGYLEVDALGSISTADRAAALDIMSDYFDVKKGWRPETLDAIGVAMGESKSEALGNVTHTPFTVAMKLKAGLGDYTSDDKFQHVRTAIRKRSRMIANSKFKAVVDDVVAGLITDISAGTSSLTSGWTADQIAATLDDLDKYRNPPAFFSLLGKQRADGSLRTTSEIYRTLRLVSDRMRAKAAGGLSPDLDETRSFKSFSKPDSIGFFTHQELYVVALREHGCLAWGGCDFGGHASGDMMHFDARLLPQGQKLKEAGAFGGSALNKLHPCWPELSCEAPVDGDDDDSPPGPAILV